MSDVSMGGTDRLADIDRELDAFGKSDEVLADVVARARSDAPRALSAIDAALEALADVAATVVETRTPEGLNARPARWDEPAPVPEELPEDASGLVEIPEEQLRRDALPPVLSLSDAAGRDTAEMVADEGAPSGVREALSAPASLELEIEGELAAAAESAEGLSASGAGGLDELFDAAPTPSDMPGPAAGAGGLESLFEPVTEAAQEPPAVSGDGELASLFEGSSIPPPVAEEPTGNTGLAELFESDRPEAEPGAHVSLVDLLTPELEAELGADVGAVDAEAESTTLFTADDLASALGSSEAPAAAPSQAPEEPLVEAPTSGELELDIDEDAIVVGEAEEDVAVAAPPPPRPKTMPPPIPPGSAAHAPGSQPPPPGQKGFFSRILNRK